MKISFHKIEHLAGRPQGPSLSGAELSCVVPAAPGGFVFSEAFFVTPFPPVAVPFPPSSQAKLTLDTVS